MENLQKYNEAFIKVFSVSEAQLPALSYQSVETWDSVGHMGLIAGLEERLDIMIGTDDIIDFNSYEKGKEILAAKYGIVF